MEGVKCLFLMLGGFSYGVMCSAGVFTVFLAVGLLPRFAGRTHTANHILLYEEMVIWGTILGNILSVFPEQIGPMLRRTGITLGVFQVLFGLFAGMFVGCLALAIAEMLDSIPIFARRVGLRHGIGCAILGVALGKGVGALWYFYKGIG